MSITKQITLSNNIMKDGVVVASLSGSLFTNSGNIGSTSINISDKVMYVKYKEVIQASAKELLDKFFEEADAETANIEIPAETATETETVEE